MKLKLVNIETPFSGDQERNLRYARACMRDSVKRGEAPIASHILYTQPGILDDADPAERRLGMECGFAWNKKAERTIVYTDIGISQGMLDGIERARKDRRKVEYRSLGPDWTHAEKLGPCTQCKRETRRSKGFGFVCDSCWATANEGYGPALVPEGSTRK